MPVNLKKTEFTPAGFQAGSSFRTFHPEATGAGGKFQSKKSIPVETQTLTFTVVFEKNINLSKTYCTSQMMS